MKKQFLWMLLLATLWKTPPSEAAGPRMPNLQGSIPVLSYHDVGYPEGPYCRTPENFKKDMRLLYEKGFRPISLDDLSQKKIPIPKGYSPFVLTFDDGLNCHYNIHNLGVVDNHSAYGLLLELEDELEGFHAQASFFVVGEDIFRQPDWISQKFTNILSSRMKIGNHSYHHKNMTEYSADQLQEELGREHQVLSAFLDPLGSKVTSFCIPFSIYPSDRKNFEYFHRGIWKDIEYSYHVVGGGFKACPSPWDPEFDVQPFIPRVHGTDQKENSPTLYTLLEEYDRHPENLFVSDGKDLP